MSDSLRLEITGESKERLIVALNLCRSQSVTAIQQCGNKLVLANSYDRKSLSFPPSILADTILEWLGRRSGSNSAYLAPAWPDEPDIDGECRHGWRLVDSGMGGIEVHPHWMIYHK